MCRLAGLVYETILIVGDMVKPLALCKADSRERVPPPADHPCPVKEAVKFLAGAWTLEIYWYLSQGSMRFGELRRGLETVSSKVLTQRLRELEELGIISRKVLDRYPPQVEYALTELGRRFIPAIEMVADVGKDLLKRK